MTDLAHRGTAVVAGLPGVQILAHFGYPAHVLTILGVWNLLGGITLLAPRSPRLTERAYAGAFFVYMGAVASGMVVGRDDPGVFIWPPLILAIITMASWALRPPSHALGTLFPTKQNREAPAQHAPAPVSG